MFLVAGGMVRNVTVNDVPLVQLKAGNSGLFSVFISADVNTHLIEVVCKGNRVVAPVNSALESTRVEKIHGTR